MQAEKAIPCPVCGTMTDWCAAIIGPDGEKWVYYECRRCHHLWVP